MEKLNLPALTHDLKPAEVSWNKDVISAYLKEQLQQFENMIVTADTVGDNKKLVADLRKKRTGIDDWRKSIKKALTEDVSLFEADVKDLLGLFDSVINPITQQCKDFEQAEKDKKLKIIKSYQDEVIEREGWDQKRQSMIVSDPKWLNKGTSLKSIKEEIDVQFAELGRLMDEEQKNNEAITEAVTMNNEANGITLVAATYVKMLDRYTLPEILVQISKDVIEANKIVEVVEPEPEPEPTVEVSNTVEFTPPAEVFTDKWSVEGTEEQLVKVEEYAKSIGVKIEVID